MSSGANSKTTRVRPRKRSRGISTPEMIIGLAVVMGCFVYPLSLAMRSTGKHIAQDSERGHDAMLTQAR